MGFTFCKPCKNSLTRREFDVLYLAAHGSGTKEIGWSLGISTKTAEKHLSNLMFKLDLHSRYDLILFAAKTGLHRELKYELRTSTHEPAIVRDDPRARQSLTVTVPARKALVLQ